MDRLSFESFDGAELSYLAAGEGRSVVLVHGFMASAEQNWVAPGLAGALVDQGFRVLALDLRGHGGSARSVGPEAWPPDALARDLQAFLARLEKKAFDLVGYSLGARTAVRAMVGGAQPRRAVLGGMGDSGVLEAGARAAMFRRVITAAAEPADAAETEGPVAFVRAMIKAGDLEPRALLGALDSFVPTSKEALAAISVPTLVIAGEDDDDNGSAEALARLLGDGEALRTPGNHLSAFATAEFQAALLRRLAG